jgi:hypothetical protein
MVRRTFAQLPLPLAFMLCQPSTRRVVIEHQEMSGFRGVVHVLQGDVFGDAAARAFDGQAVFSLCN